MTEQFSWCISSAGLALEPQFQVFKSTWSKVFDKSYLLTVNVIFKYRIVFFISKYLFSTAIYTLKEDKRFWASAETMVKPALQIIRVL